MTFIARIACGFVAVWISRQMLSRLKDKEDLKFLLLGCVCLGPIGLLLLRALGVHPFIVEVALWALVAVATVGGTQYVKLNRELREGRVK